LPIIRLCPGKGPGKGRCSPFHFDANDLRRKKGRKRKREKKEETKKNPPPPSDVFKRIGRVKEVACTFER